MKENEFLEAVLADKIHTMESLRMIEERRKEKDDV